VNFDAELEGLLLAGFDCLKEPLRQQIEEGGFDGVAALSKAEPIFVELHNRLAPFLNQADDYLPSSADLGIDIRASIFEVDVEQQLEQLRTAIASAPEHLLLDTLRTTIEIFDGFAELLSLPSFSQVGQATQQALAVAPKDLTAIAQTALEHWQRDRAFLLAGAIAQVGEVEAKLQHWGTPAPEKDMAYQFFLEEAGELLQIIESGLLTLKEERSKNKVHEIMRAAHSIKGGAASVGLGAIRTLAHHLEDYFKALYQDTVVIDTELEGLLLQGFDCLKTPLLTEITEGTNNSAECLEAAQEIFQAIEARLGDALHQAEEYIPSSSDLGIDIVTSIFEVDVQQGLEQIETSLTSGDSQAMATVLPSVLEMFQGFAELLNLPGFGEICQQVNIALTEKPEEITAITSLALENFRLAMQQVQAGDRTRGGEVLPAWAELLSASNFEDAGLLDLDGFEDAITEVAFFHIPLIRENTPTLEELFSDIDEPLLEPTISLEQLEGNSLEEVFGDLPLEEDNSATALEEVFGDLPLDEVFAGYTAPLSEEEQPSLEEVFGGSEELEAEIKAIAADFEQLPLATLPEPTLIPEAPVTPPPPPLPAPVIPAPTAPKELTKSTKVPAAGLSVRVDFDRLERMNNLVGELSINHNSLSLQNGQLQFAVKELLNRFTKFAGMSNKLRELSDLMLIAPQSPEHNLLPKTAGEETSLNEFDALEMDRYGRLYSLLQGLLEEMMQLEESVDDIVLFARGSNQTLDVERQMLTNLRDELMWARMLPLGEVLNSFPRVLRDLSAHYNKPVRLKLTGTGVLVDKAALEKLYDPLLHLLRNAFDHGIESSTVRASQGKASEGLIEIRAYHQGNQTIVEVRDDGGGLNYEKIRALALKTELITPEMAAVITKERLGDLIFEPGFSTAEVVSDLSGRGVGLDVVRDQLRSLKGTVAVNSIPGEGTTFTLRLPLTLTIAKLLVCLTHANAGIALPSDSIEEIIIPQPEQIKLSGQERFLLFANHARFADFERGRGIKTLRGKERGDPQKS
jgi:chemotaxis family two-component system sensor histidine kinase/response regulator PixL